MIKFLFKYEWLHFTRNRFQLFILFLTALLGFYAIYYGCTEIQKQRQVIEQVKQLQAKQLVKIEEGFNADTTTKEGKKAWQLAAVPGFAWHKHQYAAIFTPSALAPLSIGQRDLQPYYYKLSAMSLYYQIFQNEIANPQKLLAGNFDLSFVLIYLFPLVIIAFCYSILSSDKDKGVLPLLKSQAVPVHKIMLIKLLFYFVLLFSTAIILCIVGFIFSEISFSVEYDKVFAWVGTVLVYFLFWFTLLFLIISFNRNSAFNAISGIGLWLLFLIIIPALINIMITVAMPLNTTILSGISRRMGVANEEDDANQKAVIREFLHHHPDFKKVDTTKNLYGKGHAAFTVLRDQESKNLVENYQNQVKERDQIAGHFNVINPAVRAQNLFDAISESNLYAFQRFNHSVTAYHQTLVKFYYSKLFSDENFVKSDYLQAPQFTEQKASEATDYPIISGMMQLLIISLILFVAAYVVAQKNT
ncbi:MAG: DUF3526 domain-containing protein [Pedobacter sp.]